VIVPVRAVITDIEGTTSSISFVHDVLFPYARRHLEAFLEISRGDADVEGLLSRAAEEAGLPASADVDADRKAIVSTLLQWMDDDRKITPLKALQGMIWKAGYERGELVAHVYDDAFEALGRWHREGRSLYVYSSGSVLAQRLFFSHTAHGDLTPWFSGYFDTTTGPKQDPDSYRRIAEQVGVAPREAIFLSDSRAEIDAAREAGLRTVWVQRDALPEPGPRDSASATAHPGAATFAEIQLDSAASRDG
jgi:enolase-phosphatase E1